MRLLLDTNSLIWWRNNDSQLRTRAADAVRDPANDIVVSVAALCEIAIKRTLGKLQFSEDFAAMMADEGFQLLPITYAHLQALDALPLHHRDPFDRMMIAQALAEGIPIATADRRFAAYGVQIVW